MSANHIHTDCRTDEGITVGLIEGLIAISRIVRQRGINTPAEQEAIKDLRVDEDVRWLTASDGESPSVGDGGQA